MLDIGAGRGFLTVHLVKHSDQVIAIENDFQLVLELRDKFKYKSVKVFGVDFRQFSIPQRHFKVVSNIPYSITSYILRFLMFTNVKYFEGGSLVMQLEPAQRLVRRKFYNPYLVFYHSFFQLELIYEISPNSFIPPPTVKSALVKINKAQSSVAVEMKEKYLAFLSSLLKNPEISIKQSLKRIFRKKQVRDLSQKHHLCLEHPIKEMAAKQFAACFMEMQKIVPEKFHPK